jgi:hypothetical protein
MKKLKLIMLFSIGALFIASKSFGQSNPYLNVLPSNSGIVSVGGTIDVIVTVGNAGPATVLGGRIRPNITLPPSVTFLPSAQQTGLPAGWTIVSNIGSQLRVCNSADPIPVNGVRIITLKATGVSIAPPTTFSGQLAGGTATCGNGPLPSGNSTTDDAASSTIQVIAAVPSISFTSSLFIDGSPVTSAPCNGGLVDLAITPIGGVAPYTYSINSGTAQNSNVFEAVAAGTYTVSVIDAASLSTSSTVTIGEPTAFNIASTITNVSCKGQGNGAVLTSITGGTSPYFSILFDGVVAANNTLTSGLDAGTYTVEVLDANLCSALTTVTITEPAIAIAATVSGTNVLCASANNGTATVAVTNGTGALSYAWTTTPVQTTATASGLAGATYDVIVTDASGCTTETSITLSEPGILGGAFAATNVLCNGGTTGSVIFSATGGTTPYTYAWSNGTTSKDLTAVAAGTYSVVVTDDKGCTANVSMALTQPAAILPTASVVAPLCNGGTGVVTIAATGGTGAYTGTGAKPAQVAGTYVYTVTDANSCSATVSAVITQPFTLVAAASVVNPLCNGGTGVVTISAAGGTGTYTGTGAKPAQIAGSYAYTVTDQNSCSATVTAVITQPAAVVASAVVTSPILCNGGNAVVTVNATGGTLPYVSGTGTFNAAAGLRSFTVTDNNSCTNTTTITLTQPNAITFASTNVVSPKCVGNTNGSIAVVAAGGIAPFVYTTVPSLVQSTAGSFANVPAGSYVVTVKDATNCTITSTVVINASSALVFAPAVLTSPTCYAGTNGNITTSVTGGSGAITYSLLPNNGVQTTPGNFANLPSRIYQVRATDAQGCTKVTAFPLVQPAQLKFTSITKVNVKCNGGSDGTAVVLTSGGVGTRTLSTVPSATVSITTLSNLSATNYVVTVKDANNCTATTNLVITQPTPITWYPNVTFPATTGNNGSIVVSANGGTGVKVYKLAPVATVSGTTGSFVGLAAGSYTATATDVNGCTSTQIIVLGGATIVKENSGVVKVVEINNSLSIYPNPTVDYSTLSYEATEDQEATILVIDATGKTLKRIETSLNKGTNLVQLDLKNLPSGAYKVMIIAADQKSTKQLLKL